MCLVGEASFADELPLNFADPLKDLIFYNTIICGKGKEATS